MKILFIHPNMPGQFKHLVPYFAENPANQVMFITKPRPQVNIPNVTKIEYKLSRNASPQTHHYLRSTELATLEGQAVIRICYQLKKQGFVPDIIIAHPGWGGAMFVADCFPDSPQLHFCEFYYHAHGADTGFDPADTITEDDMARIRMRNSLHLHALAQASYNYSPTKWQKSQYPAIFQPTIEVIHDGIDVTICHKKQNASYTTPKGQRFTADDSIITYVARNFEPYRGFPSFMQTAEILLKRHPNSHIIAIGADEISYGKPLPNNQPYRHYYLDKLPYLRNHERLHFVGRVDYENLLTIFSLTRAHIYLTVPFVLSWSTLEAMACEAPIVASNTAPVHEVITHNQQGLLADFFSPQAIADSVSELLEAPEKAAILGKNARAWVVDNVPLDTMIARQTSLITSLAEGITPQPQPILNRKDFT